MLLVEDDPQIRRAVDRCLKQEYRTLAARDGEEGLRLFSLAHPDLVLVDLGLPGMDGFDLCRELRRRSRVPIVVLSARLDERDKVAALDLGADDYLVKPFGMEELLARIRAHLRRWKELPPAQFRIAVDGLVLDCEQRAVWVQDREVRLTATEFDLLLFLIQNAGKVLTHRALCQHLRGSATPEEIQALRVHVGNLRKKIEPDPSRPRYIVTEIGVGYCFSRW